MDMCEKGGLDWTCNIQIFVETPALKARLLPLMTPKINDNYANCQSIERGDHQLNGPVGCKHVAKEISSTYEQVPHGES